MTKSEKLNLIFSKKIFKKLIPIINFLITLLKSKRIVFTNYSKVEKLYIQREKGTIIYIDEQPYWNCTFKKLERNLGQICCKYYKPKEGDVIIDLGAGVGTETVVFQKLVGTIGRVYAIEAHPKTAASLELLSKLNDYKNVSNHQLAIGSKTGTIIIEDKELHVSNSIMKSNKTDGIKVGMQSLDDFVFEQEIKKIDFLKVNIEGAEEDMIDGMKSSIKIINNIAVSCHDFLETNPTERIKNKVSNFLATNGFDVIFSDDQHPVRSSWIYANRVRAI